MVPANNGQSLADLLRSLIQDEGSAQLMQTAIVESIDGHAQSFSLNIVGCDTISSTVRSKLSSYLEEVFPGRGITISCAAGKILWLYLYYSLESPPLPQVLSPEGWRTRGGATMLVRVCLVHRCCTLGEWAECFIIKKGVEPTISVFQTTPSTTLSTRIPQIFTPRFMAQNTQLQLLVVKITMYRVLFAMLRQEQLKWWFLPRPAALQTGQESTTAIYRVKLLEATVNALSMFVWTKIKYLFMDHMQTSMEPYFIMWEPHASGYSALHTMQTTYWHVPYVPSKHPTNMKTL